jgi:hypothetical protein
MGSRSLGILQDCRKARENDPHQRYGPFVRNDIVVRLKSRKSRQILKKALLLGLECRWKGAGTEERELSRIIWVVQQ